MSQQIDQKSNSLLVEKKSNKVLQQKAKVPNSICSPDSDIILISAALLQYSATDLLILTIVLFVLCLIESVEMGSLGSRFQSPSQGPEEAAEGTSTARKHGCDCKKRKRNAQCDCESEQEEDDAILDAPRR